MLCNTIPLQIDPDLLAMMQQTGLGNSQETIKRLENLGYQYDSSEPLTGKTSRFTVAHGYVSVCPHAHTLSASHNETTYLILHALAMKHHVATAQQLFDRVQRNKIPLSRQMFNKLLRSDNLYFTRGFGDTLHITPTETLHTKLYDRAMRNQDVFTFEGGQSAKIADLLASYKPGTTTPVIIPVALSTQERKAQAIAVLVHTPNNKTVKRSQSYIRAVLGIGSNSTVQAYIAICKAKGWLSVESGGISQDNSGKLRKSANEYTSKLQTQHIKLTGKEIQVSRYYFESHAEFASSNNVASFGCEYGMMQSKKIGYRRLTGDEIQNCTVVTNTISSTLEMSTDDLLSYLDTHTAHSDSPQRQFTHSDRDQSNLVTTRQLADNSRLNPDGSLSNAYASDIFARLRQHSTADSKQSESGSIESVNHDGKVTNDKARNWLSSARHGETLTRTKPYERKIELDPKFVKEFAGLTIDELNVKFGDDSRISDYGRVTDSQVPDIFARARQYDKTTADSPQRQEIAS